MCCSPWGRKESDMTEQLNLTELVPIWADKSFSPVKGGFIYCFWSDMDR